MTTPQCGHLGVSSPCIQAGCPPSRWRFPTSSPAYSNPITDLPASLTGSGISRISGISVGCSSAIDISPGCISARMRCNISRNICSGQGNSEENATGILPTDPILKRAIASHFCRMDVDCHHTRLLDPTDVRQIWLSGFFSERSQRRIGQPSGSFPELVRSERFLPTDRSVRRHPGEPIVQRCQQSCCLGTDHALGDKLRDKQISIAESRRHLVSCRNEIRQNGYLLIRWCGDQSQTLDDVSESLVRGQHDTHDYAVRISDGKASSRICFVAQSHDCPPRTVSGWSFRHRQRQDRSPLGNSVPPAQSKTAQFRR